MLIIRSLQQNALPNGDSLNRAVAARSRLTATVTGSLFLSQVVIFVYICKLRLIYTKLLSAKDCPLFYNLPQKIQTALG